MTDFKPYPETFVYFPAESPIQGTVRLHFMGNGRMGLMTETRLGRLTFRGDDSYTIHVSLQHNEETGRCEVRDEHIHLKRGMWADVPPSYARKILAACEDLATANYSSLRDREGLEADVAQRLCSLERERDQVAARLQDLADQIQAQHERLEA